MKISQWKRAISLIGLSIILFLDLPYAQINWTQTNPSSRNISLAVWTGSRIFAFGEGVFTSVDGIVWEKKTAAPPIGLTEVIWTGSLMVAIGGTGIFTSPDGETWTPRLSGTIYPLQSIAWSGSKLIVVGGAGVILSSTDGMTWKTVIPGGGAGVWLYCVAWTGREFIAAGAGLIRTSEDGESWSGFNSPTSEPMTFILQVGSTLVSAGDMNSSRFYINLGGDYTQPPVDDVFYSAIWTGSLAVAVGNKGTIVTSADGRTWERQPTLAASRLSAIVWTGSLFVALGRGGDILTSPDGKTWTTRSIGSWDNFENIIFAGNRFVATGYLSVPPASSFTATIATSANGRDWVRAYSSRSFPSVGAVTWFGNRYFANVGVNKLLVSTDAVNWTTQDIGIDDAIITRMTGAGPILLGAGHSTKTLRSTLYTSADTGKTWKASPWDSTGGLSSLGYGNGLYIVTGSDNTGRGTIHYSPDGVDWTFAPTGATERILAQAYTGKQFIAAGDSGTIFSSSDGRTWNKRASGFNNALTSIIWSGRQLVAFPYQQSWVLTSPDGAVWTKREYGNAASLNCITWSGTQFVAAGESGIFLTAPDESNTSIKPIGHRVSRGQSASFSINRVSKDRVTVQMTGISPGARWTFRILDGVGKCVQSWNGAAVPVLDIPLGGVAPGTYFLSGNMTGTKQVTAFIKAR